MKNNRRRIFALLLCMLMAVSVVMTACTPQENPTTTQAPTTTTVKPTDPEPEAAQLTFILKTQNDVFVAGVKLILKDTEGAVSEEPWICPKEDCGTQNEGGEHSCSKCMEVYLVYTVHEAVTDANGVAVFDLPDAGVEYGYTEYKLLMENLPENHVGGTYDYKVSLGEKRTVDISIVDNTPDGTKEHAYFVAAELVSKSFEAGQTLYFQAFGGVGRKIIIENANAELELLGKTYQPDANGVIAVYITGVDAEEHVPFGIKNTAENAQELAVRIESDPGTSDNPFPIIPGTQIITAEIPAGRVVYYKWVATEDGSVTAGPVDVNAGTLSIVRNRTVIGEDGREVTTSLASGYTNADGEDTVTMDYEAGDVIIIRVTVTGGAAGDVEFTFNYTEEN